MSPTVCLGTSNTLRYPQGGHLWVFINWAAGFIANGAEIIWLDVIDPNNTREALLARLDTLRSRLAPYGLADRIALTTPAGEELPEHLQVDCLDVERATSADLLFDLRYDFPDSLVRRFKHTALLDIDPGLLQMAMQQKHMNPAPHDVYFTIGETVGQPGSKFPSLGLEWVHIPPCVSLEHWPVAPLPSDRGAFSTVSHWYMNEWAVDSDGTVYKNDKRTAFLPFVELPKRVTPSLELAIHLAGDVVERTMLESNGWRVREAHEIAASPASFQQFVQSSLGEFGCAKPSYVKLQTSWISDRTICYLAAGRPAIIQNTGPSRYFDSGQGVLRFETFDDAVSRFEQVTTQYAEHAAAARALAETYFDARRLAGKVLDRCIAKK